MNLDDKILNQYKNIPHGMGQIPYTAFLHHVTTEREKQYKRLLGKYIADPSSKTLLEVGAGGGDNLLFFYRAGFMTQNLYASEIVPHYTQELKKRFPDDNIYEGNFLTAPIDKKFDVVFQSMVFSSVPTAGDRKEMAQKMKQLLNPGGCILWYDFTFDNPKNKEVKGIRKSEIRRLFSDAKQISFKRVTLAPPIGRRVGEAYGFFNSIFPFLRTHMVAIIEY